jgi:flavorubredoxin
MAPAELPAVIDPREDATAYIKEKRIEQLFRELGHRVMYHRPPDINEFLKDLLQSIKEAKEKQTPVR